MSIATLADLRPYLPGLNTTDSAEWHLPCPFCVPEQYEQGVLNKDNIPFYGEDRLFIRMHDFSLYCRKCGRHTLAQLAALLGTGVSEALETTIHNAPAPVKKPLQLMTTVQMIGAAAMVVKPYWRKFVWSDAVIKHFKLGRHIMYEVDGWAHVIPMQPRTVDTEPTSGWMLEGRIDQSRHPKGTPKIPTKRTMGSSADYFWHIREGAGDTTIVLVEGGKDGISSWVIGYRNVVVSFGTGVWHTNKTDWIKAEGYERLIVCGDNDSAGSTFSTKVCAYANSIGLTAYSLLWDKDLPNMKAGYDITNLLENLGAEASKAYIEAHLDKPVPPEEPGRAAYIPDYSIIDPNYKPVTGDDILSLEEIRGKGLRSMKACIHQFLSNYKKRKRGDGGILMLKAPPGAGKSFSLIQAAQELAKPTYARKRHEKHRLEAQIAAERERLEEGDFEEGETYELLSGMILKLEKQLADFSMASVIWFSQFKASYLDIVEQAPGLAWPGYWYDFKGRSAENCAQIELVNAMGAANHNIGEFCQTICPVRQRCLENGYLSQDRERRKYPVTVMRHQHILAEYYADYPDAIIIDESPLHVMQAPLEVRTYQLVPHRDGWGLNVGDQMQVEAIELFALATRQAMMANKGQDHDVMISGAAFLTLLDKSIKSNSNDRWSLATLFPMIDVDIITTEYQPNLREAVLKSIKPKVLHSVYDAVKHEMPKWLEVPDNKYPSNIQLVGQTLEIRKKDKLKIPKNRPIIIADATATLPELYEAIFDRPIVETYAPQIRNPNARTTVFAGSDNTVSRVQASMGALITTTNAAKKEAENAVKDVEGREISLPDIPWEDSRHDNKLFDYYVSVIEYLIEHHPSLLVVAAKNVRTLLEDYVNGVRPDWSERVSWNHFGNVRGTNMYKDLEAALLIGQFRIPYPVLWRELQSWANLLNIMEEIPLTFTYKKVPYHFRNDGYSHRTFSHKLAQRFVDFVEESEMQQAAERIRPHSTNERKYVYLLASRPSLHWITDISTEAELKQVVNSSSKLRTTVETMRARLLTGKPITQAIITKECNISTNVYKTARARLEIEMNIKLPSSRTKGDPECETPSPGQNQSREPLFRFVGSAAVMPKLPAVI